MYLLVFASLRSGCRHSHWIYLTLPSHVTHISAFALEIDLIPHFKRAWLSGLTFGNDNSHLVSREYQLRVALVKNLSRRPEIVSKINSKTNIRQ